MNNQLRVALAGFAAFALVAAACSDSADTATTTAAPETTTASSTTEAATTTADAASKLSDDAVVEVVVAAIDAKNRFDLDAWLVAFEGGKHQGTPLFAEEILMNANQQWELVEPCQVTRENADGDTVVECLISNIDDFWGTGGIFDTRAFEFSVNPDGLITSLEGLTPNENGFSSDRRNAFNQSYHLWLSDTHPDVFAEMGLRSASSNGPGFDAKDSTHMLVAVDYVEDFVAQSDTYPLDPAEQ
jgi:hypothetical protein